MVLVAVVVVFTTMALAAANTVAPIIVHAVSLVHLAVLHVALVTVVIMAVTVN